MVNGGHEVVLIARDHGRPPCKDQTTWMLIILCRQKATVHPT